MSTDINKIKSKKIGKIKIMKENKSNLIYSLKDLKKAIKIYYQIVYLIIIKI